MVDFFAVGVGRLTEVVFLGVVVLDFDAVTARLPEDVDAVAGTFRNCEIPGIYTL